MGKFYKKHIVISVILVFSLFPAAVFAKSNDKKTDIKRKYAQSLLELKVKDVELKKSRKKINSLEKEINILREEVEKIKSTNSVPSSSGQRFETRGSTRTQPAQNLPPVKRKVPWELRHARKKILLLDDSYGAMSISSDSSIRARYYLKMAEESFSKGEDDRSVDYAKKSVELADAILNRLDVLNYEEKPVEFKPASPLPGGVIPSHKDRLKKDLDDVFIPEKVNLNTASTDAMIQFLGLTKSQAKNIIWYRDTVGKITYLEELGIIPGLTPRLVESFSSRIILE